MIKPVFFIFTLLFSLFSWAINAQNATDYPKPSDFESLKKDEISLYSAKIEGEKVIIASGGIKVGQIAAALWKDDGYKKSWQSFSWNEQNYQEKFREMNDLPSDVVLKEGYILRLNPKNDFGNANTHVKLRNQSLREVSQIRNIKYKKLLELNNINNEAEVKDGDEIFLRATRPNGVTFINHANAPIYEPEKDVQLFNEKLKENKDVMKSERDEKMVEGNENPVTSNPINNFDYTKPSDNKVSSPGIPPKKATIKAGESYEEFAKKHGLTFQQLKDLNPNKIPDPIDRVAPRSDEELVVSSGENDTSVSSTSSAQTATIDAGQSYEEFAKKHGLTFQQLKDLNPGKIPDPIERVAPRADEALNISKNSNSSVKTADTDEGFSKEDINNKNNGSNPILPAASGKDPEKIIVTVREGENASLIKARANKDFPGLNLDLKELAALNTHEKDLDKLNPGDKLLVGFKMPDGSYSVVSPSVAVNPGVPAGNGNTGNTAINSGNANIPEGASVNERGEILAKNNLNELISDFAKRFNISEEQFRSWNFKPLHIKNTGSVQENIIGYTTPPAGGSPATSGGTTNTYNFDTTPTGTTPVKETAKNTSSNFPVGAYIEGSYVWLKINKDETLTAFAARALTTETDIRKRNVSIAPTVLFFQKDTVLQVGTLGEYPPSNNPLAIPAEGFVLVQDGDMLIKIAKKYGLQKNDLLAWNNLDEKTPLQKGQKIWLRPDDAMDVPANIEVQDYERYEAYTVKQGDIFANIAKKFKISPQELKILNELTSDNLVPEQILLIKKIPVPASNSMGAGVHIVQSKETLVQIAARYNLWIHDLQDWNNIPYYIGRISSGSKLFVSPTQKEDNVDLQNVDYYTIKKGDNISEIARDYNIKNATLRKLNGWEETFDKIVEGQVIKVPKPAVPEPKPMVHILLAGETFSDICTAYRVEPANLLKWNKLKADKMQWLPGMELIISEAAYNNKMRLEKQVEKPESS